MWHHHPHHPHHCVLLSRIKFYVSCRFAISKYPKYLTAARLLGQSQSSRGDKDNLSKSTTRRVQIYMYNGALLLWQNRSPRNIQERSFQYPAPGKWPHGPIHSACGTEGAPAHYWGDTPTTMTIMLKLAKNMLMNRCLMRMMQHYLFFYVTHLCFQSGCIRSAYMLVLMIV